MKREIGWDNISRDDSSVLTVGTFDGVHRGHQAIISYLKQRAEERGGTATVVSFDPHPRSVVHGREVDLLSTVEERGDLLEHFGVDRFVVVPFTKAFAHLPPVEYVEEILVQRIGLCEITVGYDHAFGRNREGDVDLLRELGKTHDFEVDVIPAQQIGSDVVSSSRVRSLLRGGEVSSAAELLGRPYDMRGTVEEGAKRGRTIGYPTANIDVSDARKLVPKIGVYAVRVHRPSAGETHAGMMNIGRRPTFDGMDVTAEVHIFDFEADLYGETIRVEFLRRLRNEQKFESADELATQLSRDEEHCRQVIETGNFPDPVV
ncbi:riboflavin biosynthesis protein RibF [Longibacter salinarum]|uniref:Riboflavin biosynthesis protein n=1 Tax=Longibacter salinarum TaxID=1850348 RepID=A0A2A8D2D3_9BACT|nr:bifunctional riboflavin kinase/FAD synthetase [Longibacter salinarum]PEN15095.1 riboflavin biosynthesis protein RibF [Longibacter salinarum]